jgi:hypothetical protein
MLDAMRRALSRTRPAFAASMCSIHTKRTLLQRQVPWSGAETHPAFGIITVRELLVACSDMVEIDSHECYLSVACHYYVPSDRRRSSRVDITLDEVRPRESRVGTQAAVARLYWGDAYAIEGRKGG